MKNYQGNEDSHLVIVGEMEGHIVEVHRVTYEGKWAFAWRAIKGGKTVAVSKQGYDDMYAALNAATEHFYPDTEEVEFKEPEAADFEALSALMYVGGLQEDITSMDVAVGMFTAFSVSLQSIALVKDKAQRDVEQIEDILASAHHGSTEAIENLNYIHGIFQSQCDVLATITERNMHTLSTFITHFLKS